MEQLRKLDLIKKAQSNVCRSICNISKEIIRKTAKMYYTRDEIYEELDNFYDMISSEYNDIVAKEIECLIFEENYRKYGYYAFKML